MNISRVLTGVLLLAYALQLRAENVAFADANVKTLCVANWDTGGDGELSMEEAAAVTSLGTVFREKTNIGSFAELRFFTGLDSIGDYAFFKSSIRAVALPASVTAIGEYAFSQSSISGELRIPGTVKSIGNYAFYNCNRLTGILLEEGVEAVGWHTFSGPVVRMVLPTSLTSMNSMAIDPYVSADPSASIFIPEGDLTVIARSTKPAPINDFAFYYVFGSAHLVVPPGCKAAYKAASGWSHFGEYLEVGDANGDGCLDITDVTALVAYVTGQSPQSFKPAAADVNGDGTVDANDIAPLSRLLLYQ